MPFSDVSFIESELKIRFGEGWSVIKLDEHRYYRRLSGHGLKGVDFLAYHLQYGVVMIEVKNYRDAEIPEDISQVVSAKIKNTKRLTQIIHKYYQRQWWFRIVNRLGWLSGEMKLWHDVYQAIEDDRYIGLGIIDSSKSR